MEGLTKTFTLNIDRHQMMIGKIDEGQKKILHFTPEEALLLLELIKTHEPLLRELVAENQALLSPT